MVRLIAGAWIVAASTVAYAGGGAEPCAAEDAAVAAAPRDTALMMAAGRCAEDHGLTASAVRWYRKAQTTAIESRDTAAELAAKERAVAIHTKVPALRIQVQGVAQAEVQVDGAVVSPLEYTHIEVDAGHHEIVAHAAGKRSVRVAIDVADGDHPTVVVPLAADATPVYIDRGKQRRRTGLIVGGLGALATAGAIVWSVHERGRWDDAAAAGDADRANGIKDDVRYIGTPWMLLGAAAVATGVVLYVTAPDKERISDGTALAPVVGDGNYGVALSGAF